MNVFPYLKALAKVYVEIRIQRRFNKKFLIPYLHNLEQKYDGTFPPPQVKKILNYYGLFIPSVLCASYKRLYGKKLTEEERNRVTLFGILTPVGDDLFDIDKLDVESIRSITYTPDAYNALTFSSKVAKQIQSYLIQSVPNKEAYIKASKDVFEIQLETIKQTNPVISIEEIERITYAKGGFSVIIYHQTLDENATPEMWQALYEIGALMQFANDCFDIYKDIHDGIFTLASCCEDYNLLKKLYLSRVKQANALVRLLPYSTSKKNEFLIIMHAIISQGLVAIDQMIRLQEKLGHPVNCIDMERKELITDMQKAGNIKRWMRYAYQLPQL